MTKNKIIILLVTVLLANMLLIPEAIAECRGFELIPGEGGNKL